MSAFKKATLFAHRWLGFISGLVVFIVSVTGCLYCFQDELQDVMHANYRKVAHGSGPYLKPSVLQKAAQARYPQGRTGVVSYMGANRSAIVRVFDSKKVMHFVYLNPYNAQFLHDENPRTNFFIVVEFIHLYLLLPPKIGKLVVGTSVIIFVVLMITGIILWWPKRKSDRKRSLTIKWGARWRRVNYDLHNVLGFYATAIAIIIALTGLSISFDWVEKGIYNAGNLGKAHPAEQRKLKSDSLMKGTPTAEPVIDLAYNKVRASSPTAEMFLFFEEAGAGGTIRGSAYSQSLHYAFSDLYTFDKHTGKLLNYLPNSKKSTGMKLNTMNYDIHVGQIAGLGGKIIAFLASLICATLPITGFIIWLGKRNKGKKKQRPKHKPAKATRLELVS